MQCNCCAPPGAAAQCCLCPVLQGQLDFNKAEVVRLRREFERVEGERDQAREAAKK